jgi:hypothetical protein
MSWAKFYCETDCQKHPFSCINEQLYKVGSEDLPLHFPCFQDMADQLAEGGYRDAGYQSVHMDDCWMQWQRDGQGRLLANQTRFPSGIGSLADYVGVMGGKGNGQPI